MEQHTGEVLSLINDYNPGIIKHCEQELYDILERFDDLKEDKKFHKGETTLIHVLNVLKSMDQMLRFLRLENKEHSEFVEPLQKLLRRFPRLDNQLAHKDGKHTCEEILFFATLFHDIGKLYHFKGLEEKFDKAKPFKMHGILGGFIFSYEAKDEISAEIARQKKKIEGLLERKKNSGSGKPDAPKWTEKHVLELRERRQIKAILANIYRMYNQYQEAFKRLELSRHDFKIIRGLIEKHMIWLPIHNEYEGLLKNYDEKVNQRLFDNIVKVCKETKDHFYESILLSIADICGTAGQYFHPVTIRFFELVLNIHEHPNNVINLATGEEIKKKEKPKAAYDFGKVIKGLNEMVAKGEIELPAKIRNSGQIIGMLRKANVPGSALAKAGFNGKAIARIMNLLKQCTV